MYLAINQNIQCSLVQNISIIWCHVFKKEKINEISPFCFFFMQTPKTDIQSPKYGGSIIAGSTFWAKQKKFEMGHKNKITWAQVENFQTRSDVPLYSL